MLIRRKNNNTNNNNLQKEVKIQQPETRIEDEVVETSQFFDVDNFDFLQRDERRRGDRRRGYRRIDDRNLVSRAQIEAVSIKEEAVKEGYKAGMDNAKADIDELKESLKEFFSYKQKAMEILSKDVLDIALDVAQTIIKKEVTQDKDILLGTIVDIIKTSTKGDERITLKVCAEDVDFVKMSIPQILNIAQSEVKISVVAKDNIEKGSVIAETANGIVDASFKTQLGVLREAFKGI